ncbi:MFS transporter [Streptomyces sp. LN245]|uniref:MFS transporter n=1 Tax=Streptomyces sp. LN245 TaxID=3112975 RepID=UPI0037137492
MESTRPAVPASSALRRPGFRLLLAAVLVNNTGGEITLLGYPLVAVALLHATPGQVGLLAAAGTLAFLVIGLPAGVWVDRFERRRVLIAADISRFALLATVPVAWWLGRLTLAHLVAVAFLTGVCRVFFDVAAQSFVPGLVGPQALMSANAALTGANSGSQIVGRALGGFLIQALTGPVAMGVNALTALWSAGCVLLVRGRGRPPSKARADALPLHRGVREGLRHVVRDPVLGPAALSSGLGNLFISITVTMLPVVLIREVGLSEAEVGLFFSVAGVGSVLGALLTPLLTRRFGHGRVLWLSAALCAPLYLLLPLADHGARLAVAALAFLVMNLRNMIGNIILVSYRQRVTPDQMLGRVNATMRFALWGMLPVGSGLSALIATSAGPRAALWVAAAGTSLAWIPVALSPLSTMRELPPPPR